MAYSLLILSPRFPSPLGKADSRTVYHMVRHFVGQGHTVYLATFREPEAHTEHEAQLRTWCAGLEVIPLHKGKAAMQMALGLFSSAPMQVWYYRHAAMRKAVHHLITTHQPDVLYGHLLRSAPYLLPYDTFPRVLGLQISYTLNYRRLLEHTRKPWTRLFYTLEYHKVKRYEPRLIRQFERVLCISEHDTAAFDMPAPPDNIFLNPHGIEVDYYAEDLGLPHVPHSIVLNADFEPPTNIDAARYFHEDIFPLVREAVPEAQLWLVGRKPPPVIQQMATDPAVTVTGFVPDLRPYLQQASVAIDPLRIGAGLQNKILVSMAARTPVVATTIANEGIAATPGQQIVLADTAETFARAVVDLLQQEERRRQIAEEAFRFVQERWTWAYHFDQLEQMIDRLLSEGAGGPVMQYMV